MIAIVWGGASNPADNRDMARWCANRIWPGAGEEFGHCSTMGVLLDSALIAVAVFHNWQPRHGVIELSAAATSKRWLTGRVLHAMFAYAFEGAGAQIVVSRTSPKDRALGRILKTYGFKTYCIPRLRGRDEDEWIHTLTDDDWRSNQFERRYHGKAQSTGTARS